MKKHLLPILIAATAGAVVLTSIPKARGAAAEPERVKPIGEGKGIHPGRVVWVQDPEATDWKGPGDGHWWQSEHTNQKRVDEMMSRAVRELAGESTDANAWDKLMRHLNQARGKGNAGYKKGEKIAIKVNFVGLIWRDKAVNPENYNLERKRDYMNTSPQMIAAVLRQLLEVVGANEADLSVGDTLSYFANEYYEVLHKAFPRVQYVDHGGKFGRVQVKPSSVPFYWSCRPEGKKQDFIPNFMADAEYVINLANLKAHTGAGVTLCAKNHFGSLVRWPVQEGYYDIHPGAFSKEVKIYRPEVDLMGHAQFGGKTVVYLIDGLYPGKHPIDQAPRRWNSPPFNGDWASSLLASQDPVAIDSVGYDFLWTEWDDYPRRPGVDDYLHEAALADKAPSGTIYDPDHPVPTKKLGSLGAHEHWNNAKEKKYSRNLGTGKGIELIAIAPGGSNQRLSSVGR